MRDNMENIMNTEINEVTSTAPDTAGGTPMRAINSSVKPRQQTYQEALASLLDYFREQGMTYLPGEETFGAGLRVCRDPEGWEVQHYIRLGVITGMVTVYTWLNKDYLPASHIWMAKRLIDAVNEHCVYAQLGFSVQGFYLYARTQVWYVDADLRPRDVTGAMVATGTMLSHVQQEADAVLQKRKLIDQAVNDLTKWLHAEHFWADVEQMGPEIECEPVD